MGTQDPERQARALRLRLCHENVLSRAVCELEHVARLELVEARLRHGLVVDRRPVRALEIDDERPDESLLSHFESERGGTDLMRVFWSPNSFLSMT